MISTSILEKNTLISKQEEHHAIKDIAYILFLILTSKSGKVLTNPVHLNLGSSEINRHLCLVAVYHGIVSESLSSLHLFQQNKVAKPMLF